MRFFTKVATLNIPIIALVSVLPASAASLGDPLDTVNNNTNVAATWKWGDYQVGTHTGMFEVEGKPWKILLTIKVGMGGNNNFVLENMKVEASHDENAATFDKNVTKNLQEGQSDGKNFTQPHGNAAKDVYDLSYSCCGNNNGENNAIFTVTGVHQAVPEPLNILGVGTAIASTILLKRKYKK